MKEHPGSEKMLTEVARGLGMADQILIDTKDTDKMSWEDLLNIWLFELGDYNKDTIKFGPDARTTKGLKIQDGVQTAKSRVLIDIEAGKVTGQDNWEYGYGVDQFFQDIEERNVVTAFLGSYHVHTSWGPNGKGGYTILYIVTNISSWESGTRLRKAASGSNIHQGIIPNRKRGETGIPLGGNLNEIWQWTEDVPNPGISEE